MNAQQSFLQDVAAAEAQTPLASPDAGDLFVASAKARGAAVGQVISTWLASAPLDMMQELLDQPAAAMPIFRPAIGPVIVMRHQHVIRCLERTDLFTVDPYATEMARASDDKARNPDAFSHFMLGTDRDDLYRLDDVIMRRVVSRADEAVLTRLCRQEAEASTSVQGAGPREIDVVKTLAKSVPMRIVSDYLGVPACRPGEPSVIDGRRGGDAFRLDDDLLKAYTFTKINEGILPTPDELFNWVKDIFRNSFNNFNAAHPKFAEFRDRGIRATEYLTAYVHALTQARKAALRDGQPVPDTMMTRLLRLQRSVDNGTAGDLEREAASLLGAPVPPGELSRRLSDSMIRSNVFGTVVGAVVNPQEATARVIDSMLRLADGEYAIRNGSTFEAAIAAANAAGDPPDPASLELLRRYALEALRLRPQGEVLLRACVKDNEELGGILIRRGTPVFVAYAAAMRDPQAVPEPLWFDTCRDERPLAYLQDGERRHEAPQSLLYLQHGFGRHKCLGRYASEITMRESLRAMLRIVPLRRLGQLEMDEQNLYVESLRVSCAGG